MPILTTDFSSLTDDLESIFNEVSKSKIAEMVGPKIFNVGDTTRKTHEHLVLHGIAGVEDVSEGQDLPKVTGEEGDTIQWTQRRYGVIVAITKDMRMFDLHNQIDSVVRSITEDAWNKLEQDYADTLSYGWDTSFTNVYGTTTASVGPDGVELFSASHTTPVTTDNFTNLLAGDTANPVLARSAIVASRVAASVHQDPNGIIRPINLDTLVVAPSNADLAERILNSPQVAGTANNDIEPLRGKIKLVVWPHLETRSDSTDTSAYWFIKKIAEENSNYVNVKSSLINGESPEVGNPQEVDLYN